jgi:formylglycine-generating enzyme required for sulfatase activity
MCMTLSYAVLAAALHVSAALPQSDAAQAARRFRDCADCPEMVVIPSGEFLMGSPADEPGRDTDEAPQRRIGLPRALAVSRTEVTRGQYAAFVRETSRTARTGCVSDRDGDGRMTADDASSWTDPGFPQTDDHPVVCVNWDDARAYVGWLNIRAGGGATYRLLSDAEWEYAARAGTIAPYPWGAEPSRDHANYGADQCCSPATGGRDQWLFTAPVGSFPANPFGLLDMHGNVSEWVQDCYVRALDELPADGTPHEERDCARRVIRNAGGSFGGTPAWARSASRSGDPPTSFTNSNVGFRVAKTL